MADRIVHCFKLKKDLPGLDRAPYRNELGQRIFNEISKEAWQGWLKDSVKFINTYRVDLAASEGQAFMLKQCSIYFGFEQGEIAATAWAAPPGGDAGAKPADSHGHEGHDHGHEGHDHGPGGHGKE
jgi:Fe-S cluster biosynthesis and repair protein YggX